MIPKEWVSLTMLGVVAPAWVVFKGRRVVRTRHAWIVWILALLCGAAGFALYRAMKSGEPTLAGAVAGAMAMALAILTLMFLVAGLAILVVIAIRD